jgi:nucleoside-diphosphate-sugar epimerase
MISFKKYLAEMEVWRGIGEGLNAAIVNPGIILGEGNWDKGSCELFKIAHSEFPFYTNGVTAWADVQDVVNRMLTLMSSEVSAERYIISSGNYSYKDIFYMMAKHMKKKVPKILAGPLLTGFIWRLGAIKSAMGQKPAITKETAMNAHLVSRYDNSKLLKHHPVFAYTPIDLTIERVSQAFLSSIVKK